MAETHWIVRQKIDIPFQYTPGAAIAQFLEALRNQKILAAGVQGEERKTVPPLSFCGRTWKPAEEWVELRGTGVMESFAIVPHSMAELPEAGGRIVFGLVRLDGAETCLVHLIHVRNERDLRIGARVRVVWSKQGTASIRDIAGFEVVR